MLERLKPYVVIWGSSVVVACGFLLYVSANAPGYIPSNQLTRIAAGSADVGTTQARLFETLDGCMRLGILEPNDMGTRLRHIYSYENDAGLLSRTTIRCEVGSCAITAQAVIPGKRFAPQCRLPRRSRRRF